mmetsp:Transcript_3574/g.10384  ORF Transcript_3574/g.10384 Transcript_3574/m.10384 type:complete len:278 (-) Transcript_3574:811-1644(-)
MMFILPPPPGTAAATKSTSRPPSASPCPPCDRRWSMVVSSQHRSSAHVVSSQRWHAGSTDAKLPASAPYTAASRVPAEGPWRAGSVVAPAASAACSAAHRHSARGTMSPRTTWSASSSSKTWASAASAAAAAAPRGVGPHCPPPPRLAARHGCPQSRHRAWASAMRPARTRRHRRPRMRSSSAVFSEYSGRRCRPGASGSSSLTSCWSPCRNTPASSRIRVSAHTPSVAPKRAAVAPLAAMSAASTSIASPASASSHATTRAALLIFSSSAMMEAAR